MSDSRIKTKLTVRTVVREVLFIAGLIVIYFVVATQVLPRLGIET